MNEATERQPTCAERVEQAWQSRRDDLSAMLDPKPQDLELRGIPERDTAALLLLATEIAEFPDREDLHRGDLFEEYTDEIKEAASEAFNEYGLAFDYVAPGTFPDQNEGFWRYQISFGGPSEEIRFFASPGPNTGDFTVYRAEFWYLDWFDGAPVDVTDDETALALWTELCNMEAPENALARALND